MTTVKKTHWFRNTLIVLVLCGIIGVVWAAVNFTAHPTTSFHTSFAICVKTGRMAGLM